MIRRRLILSLRGVVLLILLLRLCASATTSLSLEHVNQSASNVLILKSLVLAITVKSNSHSSEVEDKGYAVDDKESQIFRLLEVIPERVLYHSAN